MGHQEFDVLLLYTMNDARQQQLCQCAQLNGVLQVLETVWEAQPTLWQIMVGAGASTSSPNSEADFNTLLVRMAQVETIRKSPHT